MKNVILAMSVIAITFSSCKKNQIATSPIQQSDLLTSEAHFYCNGKPVTHQSEITNFHSKTKAILATDKIDGTLSYYFFDNDIMAEEFMNQYPVFDQVRANSKAARELREYAVQIREEEHFQKTGVISAEYAAFAAKYEAKKRIIQGTLFANVAYGAGFFNKIDGVPVPMLPVGMNNNAESAKFAGGNLNPYTLYDGFFYGLPSFTVTMNTPTLWPPFFGNIASSVF